MTCDTSSDKKGLLIEFGSRDEFEELLMLWKGLNSHWKSYTRVLGLECTPLPLPIIADDGYSYMILKEDDCSVDDVCKVTYKDAMDTLKNFVVGGST